MNSYRATEIWTRIREGELVSSEEQQEFKNWLGDKENRKAFHHSLMLEGELCELLRDLPHSTGEKERVEITEKSDFAPTFVSTHRFPWKAVGSIAALLIFTFSLSYLGELFKPTTREMIGQIVAFEGSPKVDRNKVQWPLLLSSKARVGDRIVTGPNSEMEIKLKDGSLIWIGPNSSLRVPSDFQLGQTFEFEEGMVHFEVEKREVPLSISMNNVKIEVLGTRFALQHRVSDGLERVHLQDGRVKVSIKNNGEQLMEPGQLLQYIKGEPLLLKAEEPFKIIEGQVQAITASHLKLLGVDGELYKLKRPQSDPELTHPTDLSFQPTVGQQLRLSWIEGAKRIVQIEPLTSLQGAR